METARGWNARFQCVLGAAIGVVTLIGHIGCLNLTMNNNDF